MYITMLTIFGLKGGWTSLFISFSQFVCLKNTWSLMLCSPFSPQPKRLAGCLVRNYNRKENQITHVSNDFTSKRKKKQLGSLIWAALSDILHLLTFFTTCETVKGGVEISSHSYRGSNWFLRHRHEVLMRIDRRPTGWSNISSLKRSVWTTCSKPRICRGLSLWEKSNEGLEDFLYKANRVRAEFKLWTIKTIAKHLDSQAYSSSHEVWIQN